LSRVCVRMVLYYVLSVGLNQSHDMRTSCFKCCFQKSRFNPQVTRTVSRILVATQTPSSFSTDSTWWTDDDDSDITDKTNSHPYQVPITTTEKKNPAVEHYFSTKTHFNNSNIMSLDNLVKENGTAEQIHSLTLEMISDGIACQSLIVNSQSILLQPSFNSPRLALDLLHQISVNKYMHLTEFMLEPFSRYILTHPNSEIIPEFNKFIDKNQSNLPLDFETRLFHQQCILFLEKNEFQNAHAVLLQLMNHSSVSKPTLIKILNTFLHTIASSSRQHEHTTAIPLQILSDIVLQCMADSHMKKFQKNTIFITVSDFRAQTLAACITALSRSSKRLYDSVIDKIWKHLDKSRINRLQKGYLIYNAYSTYRALRGDVKGAANAFGEMIDAGFHADSAAYTAMFNAFARAGMKSRIHQLYASLFDAETDGSRRILDGRLFKTVIKSSLRCYDGVFAVKVIKDMSAFGFNIDERVLWMWILDTVLNSNELNGYLVVKDVVELMKNENIELSRDEKSKLIRNAQHNGDNLISIMHLQSL